MQAPPCGYGRAGARSLTKRCRSGGKSGQRLRRYRRSFEARSRALKTVLMKRPAQLAAFFLMRLSLIGFFRQSGGGLCESDSQFFSSRHRGA